MAISTLNFIFEDAVNGGQTDLKTTEIVPDGSIATVVRLGGYDRPVDSVGSIIAFQWGSGASWETFFVFGHGFVNEYLNKSFTGDGVKRFRLVRQNKSLVAKEMVAWADVVVQGG